MPANTCPSCGGSMRPVLVGELHDKHLRCEYCDQMVDLPDESSVEVTEREEGVDEHGRRYHRVRHVVTTRRDLQPEDVAAAALAATAASTSSQVDIRKVAVEDLPPEVARSLTEGGPTLVQSSRTELVNREPVVRRVIIRRNQRIEGLEDMPPEVARLVRATLDDGGAPGASGKRGDRSGLGIIVALVFVLVVVGFVIIVASLRATSGV